jgi:predicted RNA binding protein YcfA (HicA-like mRNA interferase family)
MIDKSHIDRLKAIPITDYLAAQGFVPARRVGSQLVYISPLTNEKTASFFVHPDKNVFNCFSSGHKGDIITLVRELEQTGFQDALRKLSGFSPAAIDYKLPDQLQEQPETSQIELLAVKTLSNRALINYLRSRGISDHLGTRYLQEAYFRVYGKQVFALALPNDKGGYELRNSFYKGCALAKAPTTITGRSPGGEVNIFEGVFDFLSALTYHKTDSFNNDTVILSSLWLFDEGYQNKLLEKYSRFNLFLDNDRAGWRKAIEFRKKITFFNLSKTFQNHSSLYKHYKDFNLFLLNQLESPQEI